MTAALDLEAVSRRFGTRLALAPLNLRLSRGSVCTVEGANGAGKTTLLRIAAGLLAPSTGTRAADGMALYARSGSGARAVDRVDGSVARLLHLAGLPRSEVRRRADDVLCRLALQPLAERRVDELSAGERGRLSLALVAAVRPAIACLDEPTASLDVEGRRLAAEVVGDLAAVGCAVLVATHDPDLLPDADGRLVLTAGLVA